MKSVSIISNSNLHSGKPQSYLLPLIFQIGKELKNPSSTSDAAKSGQIHIGRVVIDDNPTIASNLRQLYPGHFVLTDFYYFPESCH